MKKLLTITALLALALQSITLLSAHAEDAPEVMRLMRRLQVGEPVTYQNLTIFPVYSTRRAFPSVNFLTLDEAIKRGFLKVEEFQGGNVPKVKVTNNSDRYVFLMGGEILTGCKQDRLVGRDVLLQPGSKDIVVPVYCVEHGRWTQQSQQFYSKENLGTFELRAEAQQAGDQAQQKIWDRVANIHSKNKVSSSTGAYQDAYEKEEVKRSIVSYEKNMDRVLDLYPDTVGVVIAVGGRIVSADIFTTSDTFKKLWPKLLKSAALSALNAYSEYRATQEDAAGFLRSLYHKDYAQRHGVDGGIEYQAVDAQANVNTLTYNGLIIHIAAFASNGKIDDQPEWFNQGRDHRIPVM